MTAVKPKLYLETTVPSYLTSQPSRDLVVAAHQQVTRDWWAARRQDFEMYVSQFVVDEASGGDPAMAAERIEILEGLSLLELTPDVGRLAAHLIGAGVIPAKAATDAAHVAVAAVHGMDYLLTWNCAHIANAAIARRLAENCKQLGFTCPVICTPEELLEIAP
jgi:hypothetical protein